jgi:uncharacterized membrane protein
MDAAEPEPPADLPPLRRPSWRVRLLLLLGPFVLTGLLAALLWLVASRRIAIEVLTAAGLSFVGMGTTVILTPALVPDLSLDAWELAWLVMYVNGLSAFLYAYNLDLLERLPWIGTGLKNTRRRAQRQLKEHPWIRRLATFGVGLFVLTPLPGSGSLGGCVVGRIVGLTRWRSFLTVTLAGAVVSVAYAAFGGALKAWLDARGLTTPFRVGGAVVAVLLLLGVVALLRRFFRTHPLPREAP